MKLIFSILLSVLIISCQNENNHKQNAVIKGKTKKEIKPKVKEKETENLKVKTSNTKRENKIKVDSIRKQLQGDFDTVLFYKYKNSKLFFYIAKGYNISTYLINQGGKDFKMGIVDKNNKVIIPAEYDYVYSLQEKNYFVSENNQKLNVFDINGVKYFQKDVDGIYPVSDMKDVICQFKNANTYGWLATDGTIHNMKNPGKYSELTQPPTVNNKINTWRLTIEEVLQKPYKNIIGDLNFFIPYWFREYGIKTIYTEVENSHFILHIDTISSINNNYKIFDIMLRQTIDAGCDIATREEHCLNLIDFNGKIIKQINIPNEIYLFYQESEFNWSVIGDTLLEIQYGLDDEDSTRYHLKWKYYKFNEKNEFIELQSNRLFPFTHFIVMNDNHPNIHFTEEEYNYMRNEIFASYGYKFKTGKWQETFSKYAWYKPLYDNIDDSLTHIERKNIQYLLNKK